MSAVIKPALGPLKPLLEGIKFRLNDAFKDLEPWQVAVYTSGITLASVWVYEFIFQPGDSLTERTKKSVFRLVKKIPFVKNKIDGEMKKTSQGYEETIFLSTKGQSYVEVLPAHGLTEEGVMKEIEKYREIVDMDWGEGCCSGLIYNGGDELTQMITKVYGQFAWTNPLHADVFPDVRKMEAEVVRMTCNMFNGSADSCGTMTTGGTESILLACKVYRNMAYDRGIKHPEMIVPETAHPAFDKAANFFVIKIHHVAVDPITRKLDIRAMKKAINSRTCMLLGSAPQFPHGVVDPIVDIAMLGVKYNIPVHVDCCLGGFLLPFMKKAGYPLDPFDFTVPGVTSISADTHKYGFAPKGSSVIMYSHTKYRTCQIFVQPDWPGGVYTSPTLSGSRAGAIMATCWATMMYMGEDGYVEATRKIIQTTKYIESGLRKIDNIFIYGQPEVSVVGFSSNDFDIYRLSGGLRAKGWKLNNLQFPSSLHLCCTMVHTKEGVADRFIRDVDDCTAEIMKDPNAPAEGQAALYGMAQSIPDRSLVSEVAATFFDGYYSTRAPLRH